MFIKGEVSISRCAIVAPRAKKTLRTRNGSKNILSYAPKHVKRKLGAQKAKGSTPSGTRTHSLEITRLIEQSRSLARYHCAIGADICRLKSLFRYM